MRLNEVVGGAGRAVRRGGGGPGRGRAGTYPGHVAEARAASRELMWRCGGESHRRRPFPPSLSPSDSEKHKGARPPSRFLQCIVFPGANAMLGSISVIDRCLWRLGLLDPA